MLKYMANHVGSAQHHNPDMDTGSSSGFPTRIASLLPPTSWKCTRAKRHLRWCGSASQRLQWRQRRGLPPACPPRCYDCPRCTRRRCPAARGMPPPAASGHLRADMSKQQGLLTRESLMHNCAEHVCELLQRVPFISGPCSNSPTLHHAVYRTCAHIPAAVCMPCTL